jgi:3-methylfumaryl-CoA hydratase
VARAATALPSGDLRWDVATPPTLLFRYSALTFNSHRIHYDAPYAMAEEGYPGLVVHGPLQATLLLNLAATLMGRVPRTFRYRATAPLIAGEGLHAIARVEGEGVVASVHAADGTETLRATAA